MVGAADNSRQQRFRRTVIRTEDVRAIDLTRAVQSHNALSHCTPGQLEARGYGRDVTRCRQDRGHDLSVPCAAAEDAGEGIDDVIFYDVVRLRAGVQKGGGRYQHPRSAKAALGCAVFKKSLTKPRPALRMGSKALDGCNFAIFNLSDRGRAGANRLAPHEYRAGSAITRITTDLCSSKP